MSALTGSRAEALREAVERLGRACDKDDARDSYSWLKGYASCPRTTDLRLILDALAAKDARVEALEAALRSAASDFHLTALHGDLNSMWREARAGRDRARAALEGSSRGE